MPVTPAGHPAQCPIIIVRAPRACLLHTLPHLPSSPCCRLQCRTHLHLLHLPGRTCATLAACLLPRYPAPPLTLGPSPPPCAQACFSVLIFILLSSQDGFQTEWKEDEHGVLRAPAIYNGARRCAHGEGITRRSVHRCCPGCAAWCPAVPSPRPCCPSKRVFPIAGAFSALSFIVGAITSILSGYLGM